MTTSAPASPLSARLLASGQQGTLSAILLVRSDYLPHAQGRTHSLAVDEEIGPGVARHNVVSRCVYSHFPGSRRQLVVEQCSVCINKYMTFVAGTHS
jgi:hypothetical protein